MATANLSKTERIDVRASTLIKQLLQDAARAADIVGIRCLLVHAKDDIALWWYEMWEFEPSPTDPYHLFLNTMLWHYVVGELLK